MWQQQAEIKHNQTFNLCVMARRTGLIKKKQFHIFLWFYYKNNYNIVSCFVWVPNLVAHIEGGTQTQGV